MHGIRVGSDGHAGDDFHTIVEQCVHALDHIFFPHGDDHGSGHGVVLHVVAAHVDSFRDFLDVLGLHQPGRVLVKLLVKDVFIGLADPGEPPLDDGQVGKPPGDEQAHVAATLGNQDVDHGRACVRAGNRTLVNLLRVHFPLGGRVVQRSQIAYSFRFRVGNEFPCGKIAVRIHQETIRHGPAGILCDNIFRVRHELLLYPRCRLFQGFVLEPLLTLVRQRASEPLPVKAVQIREHLKDGWIARGHHLNAQQGIAPGAIELPHFNKVRVVTGLRNRNHLGQGFIGFAGIDPAAQLPVDTIVSQFVAAVALDDSLPVLLGNNVEMVGDTQEDFILPWNLFLQEFNIFFESIRVLG